MEANTQTKPLLSDGQKVMRVTFNPSNTSIVDEIKQRYADMWDQLELLQSKELSRTDKDSSWKNRTGREFARAKTFTEDACMNAVKALTAYFQD